MKINISLSLIILFLAISATAEAKTIDGAYYKTSGILEIGESVVYVNVWDAIAVAPDNAGDKYTDANKLQCMVMETLDAPFDKLGIFFTPKDSPFLLLMGLDENEVIDRQ